MVPFAGWDMPINYGDGILAEVRAVRTAAGMFDVSHMARFRIEGEGAAKFLNAVLSVDVPAMRFGQAKYHMICDERGGIIDDALIYRINETRFLLVSNAGNAPAVEAWIRDHASRVANVEIETRTQAVSMIAVQGPTAVETVATLTSAPVAQIRPFRFATCSLLGAETVVARTGYTGEDGFEILPPADHAETVWLALRNRGVAPCGLGARDVLRLEAGLMLHGSDMDRTNDPYEAGLDRFVDPDREGYIAGPALRAIRDRGPSRKLVGFRMVGRGIPRHGQTISHEAEAIGAVTSGTHSPTLNENIGMGYVTAQHSAPGAALSIDVRGREIEAEVVKMPFYKRKRS